MKIHNKYEMKSLISQVANVTVSQGSFSAICLLFLCSFSLGISHAKAGHDVPQQRGV